MTGPEHVTRACTRTHTRTQTHTHTCASLWVAAPVESRLLRSRGHRLRGSSHARSYTAFPSIEHKSSFKASFFSPLVLPPVTKLLAHGFVSLLLHRGRLKLLVKSSTTLPTSLSWLLSVFNLLMAAPSKRKKIKTQNKKGASPRMPHPHSTVSSLSRPNFLKAVSTFTVSLSFPPTHPLAHPVWLPPSSPLPRNCHH